MIQLSYEDMVRKIREEKGLSDEEIKAKIDAKLKQLSDLISREGAAHIVANELGVKVLEEVSKKDYKLKDLLVGLRGVGFVGKVVRMYDVREFKKNDREGKVGSFLVGDETGFVRVVLWDVNHIGFIEKGELKEGSIIKLDGGYVRDNNGFKEVHLGNQGSLQINPEGVSVETRDLNQRTDYVKKQLKDLNQGDMNIGVLGTVVQVFEPRFFSACPECGKKVEVVEGKAKCAEHGDVIERYVPILNIFFDDGTDNIRAVCFRDQVSRLLGLSEDEVLKLRDEPAKFEEIRASVLGKQLILVGRVVRNDMFDRLEFMANRVVEIKPEDILKELESD